MAGQAPHVLLIAGSEIALRGLAGLLKEQRFTVRSELIESLGSRFRSKPREGAHVTIIDRSVPQPIELARRLLGAGAIGGIAILAEDIDDDMIADAVRLGSVSLISNNVGCDALEAYLYLLASGEVAIPLGSFCCVKNDDPIPVQDCGPEACALTERERYVARILASGHSNKMIARELELTEATVKVHVKAILRKLQFANRTQIAIWASRNGAALGLPLVGACVVAANIAEAANIAA